MSVTLTEKSLGYVETASEFLKASSLIDRNQREKALELFKDIGLPTKKNENYKYTNLNKVFPEKLDLAKPSQVTSTSVLETPAEYTLVFDNGQWKEELSHLPKGLTLLPLTESSQPNEDKPLVSDTMEALNSSMVENKYLLKVEKNSQIPLVTLLHRIEADQSQVAMTSLHISVEIGAEAEFFEVIQLEEERENTSITQTSFELAANAKAKHTKALLTKSSHIHVGKVKATLARDAHFTSLTFSVDGKMNRNNVEVFIEETGAHASVNGLYTGRSSQHQDCFTTIHHNAAHTTSDQVFKGILDDEARGVFTGKIVIHRDAQQVDSNQLNKNLLLSKKAHVDTRPQIEVYADDVKCGHGATVGQINEEEVFYLESRGIPKEKAQKILCHAFAFEAIESCAHDELSTWLGNHLFELFEKYALEHLNVQ